MGFFSKLFGFDKKQTFLSDAELIEASACPNCWGKQEYEGAYKAFVDDQTKSNVNKDKTGKKAFVAQWVETNLTGIKLQNQNDALFCPSCKLSFKL